ncbi:MAG: RNA polymerase sigma factor [Acidobacteria bacterium]|nr:RNA polymerase sigma factor [Acidobacteriota bacterium]
MTETTDKERLVRLKAGDASAFDEVFDAWRPRLFAFLVRLCGRRDLAEDLLQETWIRLACRAVDLREDTCLGPWLFRVARNLYYSHLRSRNRDAGRLGEVFAFHWPSAATRTPLEELSAGERGRRLERAVAALPLIYREMVLLVGVAGMSPSEAAAVAGLTPEAARKRLSRAREKLAGLMEEG